MAALTIGMATYKDFDGVYFTIQALRLYQDLDDVELLVVDNFGCESTRKFVEGWINGRYILAKDAVGTAAPRELVMREAAAEAVLCCDSHVLFAPGTIARLKAYYRDNPECRDLLQGPLWYDNLLKTNVSTHFDPAWRAQMWGTWGADPRGLDPEGEPFDIPMQGLGVFSCRKAVWPGFNPRFRGFGGEEGYIHEKFRQAGGRCLCLPWLRWVHRFGRPAGAPYPLTNEDKLRNYLVGHAELGLDLRPIVEHFLTCLPQETVVTAYYETLQNTGSASPGPSAASAAGSPPTDCSSSPRQDDALPLVSCICPTFNRAPEYQHLLEETIESFLRQTYPNKELIVLNDCPGQELACDAPGVRVVNLPERLPTLGDKYNAAIALARGELIAPWEDDDISLPWRLSLSVERMGATPYYNPQRYWFFDGRGLHADHAMGYGHNLSLFTREAFTAVGGYLPVSGPQDMAMHAALEHYAVRIGGEIVPRDELPCEEWFYIYRWGVSPVHLSGFASPADRYREAGSQLVQHGRFVLHPHWKSDHVAATRWFLSGQDLLGQAGLNEAGRKGTSVELGNAGARASSGILLFVLSDRDGFQHDGGVRTLPKLNRGKGESPSAHRDRVASLVNEAVAAGGTHLVIPRELADWLGDHPRVGKYLSRNHDLIEARDDTGLVFALRGR